MISHPPPRMNNRTSIIAASLRSEKKEDSSDDTPHWVLLSVTRASAAMRSSLFIA